MVTGDQGLGIRVAASPRIYEGGLIPDFPFRPSYHRPFDRERNRFLAPLEMTILESLMSTSHELLENPNP